MSLKVHGTPGDQGQKKLRADLVQAIDYLAKLIWRKKKPHDSQTLARIQSHRSVTGSTFGGGPIPLYLKECLKNMHERTKAGDACILQIGPGYGKTRESIKLLMVLHEATEMSLYKKEGQFQLFNEIRRKCNGGYHASELALVYEFLDGIIETIEKELGRMQGEGIKG